MDKQFFLIAAGGGLLIYFLKDKLWPVFDRDFSPPKGFYKFKDLVLHYSSKHRIRPAIVSAVIHQESNWNPNAFREEPKVKDASRGLGQILLGTARQYGYKGTPEGLFDPATNVDWTAYILISLWNKYKNNAEMFSAYNAGTPKRKKNGKFVNQEYVDSVTEYYKRYLKII